MSKRALLNISCVVALSLALTACGDRKLGDDATDTCHYGGKTYSTGDVFKSADGCNSCQCNPESTQGVGCSAKTCGGQTQKDTCYYNGKTYKAGEVFTATDGCNSCQCNPTGSFGVGCTKKSCVDLGGPDAGGPEEDDAYSNPCGIEGTICGYICINTHSDPQHCGECFNACGSNVECKGGKCGPYF